MKLWKKLSITFLILFVISQLPFAYRRYRLGLLNAVIQRLNSERLVTSVNDNFDEYKGVIHVRSFLGGHSSGGFGEIIDAAKANGLQFVVMTEHPAKDFNTAETTLKGMHAGILFINGNEVSTREGDRLLVIPGDELTGSSGDLSTRSVIERAKSRGELTVVAYPEEFKSWNTDGFGGIEVYNVYTNARRINPIVVFFDSLWSYGSYHDLLFATFYTRPEQALARWDAASRSKKVVGLAGNDAHANIGLSLIDSSGKTILGVQLDPYQTSLRLVRVHLFLPKGLALDAKSLVDALAMGHCFIGFDLFGDTSGFSFTASSASMHQIQGDDIPLVAEVRLSVSTPAPGRIVLFRDGMAIQEETSSSRKDFVVREKGSYRVEVYLPQLGHPAGEQPWIVSNPIYVR